MAIADAYDAMTHDRPHKAAIGHDEAIRELRHHAGTQFDPDLVGLFCDFFSTTAPVPDPSVLAMNGLAHAGAPRRARGRRRETDIAARAAG